MIVLGEELNGLEVGSLGVVGQTSELHGLDHPAAMQSLVAHLRWVTRQMGTRDDVGMGRLCHELAFHLASTGDYAGARPLYERALAITEQALGFAHPTTQTIRANLAALDSLTNEG